MAENKPVQYYLDVASGPDKGSALWLTDEPIKVGTVDGCALVLSDPDVGAEHVEIALVRNRVWVENLSAKGALLGGKLLQHRTIMVVGEVLELGENTKVALRSTAKSSEKPTGKYVVLLILALAILGGLILAITSVKPRVKRAKTTTHADWERAYGRLQKRLDSWVSQDMIDRGVSQAFAQAWFRDCSGDRSKALAAWKKVYNAMVGVSIEGVTPENKTMATGAETSPESLRAFMARNMDDDAWRHTDEAYADAIWWFVSKRIRTLSSKEQN